LNKDLITGAYSYCLKEDY